jgi:hypothetical protein
MTDTEPDYEELTTLERFRQRASGSLGVIVISDPGRDTPIAHHRECPFVTEDGFVEKVVRMRNRNGRYYWARNSKVAAAQLGARRCRHPADKLAGH